MKRLVFNLLFLICVCSCSTVRSIPSGFFINTKPTLDCIVEDLQNKKIVMLGENHAILNEEIFLLNNFKTLYDAGVRYLFTEGVMPSYLNPSDKNYFFFMFNPWVGANWKYEMVELYVKINNFNQNLPFEDRIKMIVPELGRIEVDSSDPSAFSEFINYRDDYAFNTIIKTLSESKTEERALILYGAGHADASNIDLNRNSLGKKLKNYYKDKFSNYCWYTNDWYFNSWIYNNSDWKDLFKESRVILAESMKNLTFPKDLNAFTGYILEPQSKYGTFYQYTPTPENLRYIFNKLKYYEQNIKDIENDKTFEITNNRYQYLISIYILKYYYGSNFEYDFWTKNKEENRLINALEKLYQYAFTPDKNPEDFVINKYSSVEKERLHQYYINSGIMDSLITKNLKIISEEQLKKIIELNSQEAWGTYWLAYVKTEKLEYQEALNYWMKFFELEISRSMEVYPLALSMAIKCAEKINNIETVKKYKTELSEIGNEHSFNVNGYSYSGYF